MELYTELSLEELTNKKSVVNMQAVKFDTIKIQPNNSRPLFSPLALFFLIPILRLDANVTSIPIYDSSTKEAVLRILAPHFEDVSQIKNELGETDLSLKSLKETSRLEIRNLIQKNKLGFIGLIMTEIYEETDVKVSGEPFSKIYSIHLEKVSPLINNDLSVIWDFIKNTYIKRYGFFSINPINWIFDDSLIERLTTRHMAALCNEIILFVDKNNQVNSIILR